MIMYIYGDDTFRSRQFLKKSIIEFKSKRDPLGYNTLIFNANSDSVEKIITEITTIPFLAEKRMVVIENLLTTKNNNLLNSLEQLIVNQKLSSEIILVVWQSEKIGRTKEVKKLEEILLKEKYQYHFPLLSKNDLPQWITKEIILRGGKIDKKAVNLLAQNIGEDMWLLNTTIDQLIAYKNGEIILVEDIKLFIEDEVDENIFNFIDAVIAQNKKLAFKLLNDQRKIGQDDGYIFAMILRQFKILLQIRDLWEQTDQLVSDDLAKKLGLHPFVVKKSLPLVKRYNMVLLKDIYNELYKIDFQTKTGVMNQGFLIDYFIGKR